MTLKIIGPYSSPTLYSSEPGRVYLTSSDPSIATVPEYVDVPGTVEYYNNLGCGQYLARANCLQNRLGVSFVFEIDWDKMQYGDVTIYSPTTTLVANWNADGTNRANWIFVANVYVVGGSTNGIRINYYQSITGAHNMTGLTPVTHNEGARVGKRRYVFLLPPVATDNNLYTYYIDPATPFSTVARNLLTAGTMGGNEICAMQTAGVRWGKYARLLDQSDRALWLTSNIFPSTAEAYFDCSHELNESNPVFYDGSENALDFTAVNVPQWPLASASEGRNETVTIEPWQAFALTPISSGTVTITATRRRAGVPDRASTVEKFETATADYEIIFTHGKDYNTMQSVVLANHTGLQPVEDMTIAFRALVTSLPTASTKMIDCGVGADDLLSSWQVILNPAGTLTLGGMSGSSYVSVTSSLTISAGVETVVIIKKNGTSINLIIGESSEVLTLATDWDYWSSDVTVRIGDVGFSGAVWDLYTFTRLIAASEVTKFKAGYRVSNYAYHNSLQTQDGKISGGYVSGFLDL